VNVPVENLYYLLCYAWDHLEATRLVDVRSIAGRSPEELLARMLGAGVVALLKRGLDRDYVSERDDLRVPRGKLDLTSTMKRNLMRRQRVACDFDELQADVLHNRLIKATLTQLVRVAALPGERRKELRDLAQRMAGVSDVEVRVQAFRRVRLHRNNRHYAFVLSVCELLHRHLLPTQVAGEWRLEDFRGSDREMGHLFEAFVRNFVRREMPAVRLLSRSYKWAAEAVGDSPLDLLPGLETDVPMRLGDRSLIVECKFTRHPLITNRWGKRSLRSSHLNQLYAYLANVGTHWSPPPAGLLLYAAVDGELDLHYRLRGRDILVRTLDLARPWRDIHMQLEALLLDAFHGTASAHSAAAGIHASM
jgi:5-methylcytosine-specific restriction enzyme subunit McrC